MAPPTTRCYACGKSGGKLLGCARCQKEWFCNRECQAFARAELGHRGANCRAVDAPPPDAAALAQASAALQRARLIWTFGAISKEARAHCLANTRIGQLAAAEKLKEAAAATDHIGGAYGADLRSDTDQLLSQCLVHSGDLAAAARAAASSLQAARVSGNRTVLVVALANCGRVAQLAPTEMIRMEKEGRAQEERLGSLGVALLLEGRVSLPTTARATRSMGLAYAEVALAMCDAALAAAGGRGSPAAADHRRVPSLLAEVTVRDSVVACLAALDEDRPRVMELTRQLVALSRQMVRTAAPSEAHVAQRMLANQLSDLGCALMTDECRVEEAEACLCESLALGEGMGDVLLTTTTLRLLVNLCNFFGHADATVAAAKSAEAEALRSRLNQLLVQTGRSSETDCAICLESLAQDAGAAGGGVAVLSCNHQFHVGCTMAWQKTTPKFPCPICKQ